MSHGGKVIKVPVCAFFPGASSEAYAAARSRWPAHLTNHEAH